MKFSSLLIDTLTLPISVVEDVVDVALTGKAPKETIKNVKDIVKDIVD